MLSMFNQLSYNCSKKVTTTYSSSFSLAVKMLAPSIQPAIHSIYGFVRFADEIVDTFHQHDKEFLLEKFEKDFLEAYEKGISLNPILNAFQQTVRKYNIDLPFINAFLKSMRWDLTKKEYMTDAEYREYIYGSADVVGLMCLKVFVNGDEEKFNELKDSAMYLGSAFQKVNFLRDIKSDTEILERSYFPNVDFNKLDQQTKDRIIHEIEEDFEKAYEGIVKLPKDSKFGVYSAYIFYRQLLVKLRRTDPDKILEKRIRVRNYAKLGLLMKSYLNVKLNLL